MHLRANNKTNWQDALFPYGRLENKWVQVNFCQKLFFLQNMGRTCCIQKLFWMSETISVHNMSLRFSCNELLIQWTICCHIVDTKLRASDKDLPVLHDGTDENAVYSQKLSWCLSCKYISKKMKKITVLKKTFST